MVAAEVFMGLRSKSIFNLFAAIGRFLGLEVIFFSFLLLYGHIGFFVGINFQLIFMRLHVILAGL